MLLMPIRRLITYCQLKQSAWLKREQKKPLSGQRGRSTKTMSSATVTYLARWISLFHFLCFLLHRDPLTKNTDCMDLFKKKKKKKDFWNMKQYFEDQKEPALLLLPHPTLSVRTMLQTLHVQIWISKLRVMSPRVHRCHAPNNTT